MFSGVQGMGSSSRERHRASGAMGCCGPLGGRMDSVAMVLPLHEGSRPLPLRQRPESLVTSANNLSKANSPW